MATPKFNDRIITEGLPDGWYIQDRLDEGEALLCKRTDLWPGNTCVCLKPRAIPTNKWIVTAIRLAKGFDEIAAPADRIAELEAALRAQDDMIDWIYDTLQEININNYGHDDVCRLNDASVEVLLAIDDQVEARATLKGKTDV